MEFLLIFLFTSLMSVVCYVCAVVLYNSNRSSIGSTEASSWFYLPGLNSVSSLLLWAPSFSFIAEDAYEPEARDITDDASQNGEHQEEEDADEDEYEYDKSTSEEMDSIHALTHAFVVATAAIARREKLEATAAAQNALLTSTTVAGPEKISLVRFAASVDNVVIPSSSMDVSFSTDDILESSTHDLLLSAPTSRDNIVYHDPFEYRTVETSSSSPSFSNSTSRDADRDDLHKTVTFFTPRLHSDVRAYRTGGIGSPPVILPAVTPPHRYSRVADSLTDMFIFYPRVSDLHSHGQQKDNSNTLIFPPEFATPSVSDTENGLRAARSRSFESPAPPSSRIIWMSDQQQERKNTLPANLPSISIPVRPLQSRTDFAADLPASSFPKPDSTIHPAFKFVISNADKQDDQNQSIETWASDPVEYSSVVSPNYKSPSPRATPPRTPEEEEASSSCETLDTDITASQGKSLHKTKSTSL